MVQVRENHLCSGEGLQPQARFKMWRGLHVSLHTTASSFLCSEFAEVSLRVRAVNQATQTCTERSGARGSEAYRKSSVNGARVDSTGFDSHSLQNYRLMPLTGWLLCSFRAGSPVCWWFGFGILVFIWLLSANTRANVTPVIIPDEPCRWRCLWGWAFLAHALDRSQHLIAQVLAGPP